MLTQKQTLIFGSILGFLCVALGTFAAHALKPTLLANGRLDTFELAVRYQFYHSLTLLFLGYCIGNFFSNLYRWSATFIFSGILLFSGSLYLLALTNITSFAMLTPVGGIAFLIGWVLMLVGFTKLEK